MVLLPVPALATLPVRTAHVLAAAVAVGGAALVYATARRRPTPVTVAVAYEWWFWGATAVLVATGVGNLGALAPSLPRGRWGAILAVKLLLAVVALALSTVRTIAVCRLRHGAGAHPGALRRWYGATAVGFATLVAAAEVLAHG